MPIEIPKNICYNVLQAGGIEKMTKQSISTLIQHFHQISGMEIMLTDNTFHAAIVKRCPYENLCVVIHRSSACLDICKGSDAEGYEKARRLDSAFTYVCPFGITETIIPIKRNEKTMSYIFCSMGILDRSDEEIAEQIMRIMPSLPYREVLDATKKMPHLNSEQFQAYSTMLKLLVEHIERSDIPFDPQLTIGLLTKQYIKKNLAKKITLADISWELHYSTVTLTKRFREEFGITIMDYVTQKRMELAEQLLTETSKSVKEISTLSGFSDTEYFSRCFKRSHGIPPGTWRQTMQNSLAGDR